MALFNNIRLRIAGYILQKGITSLKRNKKLVSLNTAGSVGLLFELSDHSVYYAIQDFFQKLQENKIKVKALGYCGTKNATSQFLPVLSFDFISGKDLNWLLIPKAKCVADFIETDFDICINIASEDIFPLKYIAGMSKAKLKAGAYNNVAADDNFKALSQIYDIMLKSEPIHNQISFLGIINDYLSILNSKGNV
ncbi:MAG: hypothetical protein KA096_02595 [Bacteroidales bacterium]|nr:hypothetical protein [Bacteroidales bacterium]